jgi:hypothetical protein
MNARFRSVWMVIALPCPPGRRRHRIDRRRDVRLADDIVIR